MRRLAPVLIACVIIAAGCSSPGRMASVPAPNGGFTRPASINGPVPPPPPSFVPHAPSSVTRKPLAVHPSFFAGEVALTNGVYYLRLPNGNVFGYYSYLPDQNYIYHFDMGYEYVFDANDGKSGVYLYDFYSKRWWYTSPQFSFPYIYDFANGGSVEYYYPDSGNPGHYTSYPRYFYVFGNQPQPGIQIIPAEPPDWTFNAGTTSTPMTSSGGSTSVGSSQGVTWAATWGHNNATGTFTLTSSLAVSPSDATPSNFFPLSNGWHVVSYLKLVAVPAVRADQVPAQTITVNSPSTFGGTQCSLYNMNASPTGLSWPATPLGPYTPSGNTLAIPATTPPSGTVDVRSAGNGGPTILALACH